MIGRLLCWCGLHVKPRGMNPRWTFTWFCDRCERPQPGALSRR